MENTATQEAEVSFDSFVWQGWRGRNNGGGWAGGLVEGEKQKMNHWDKCG